MKRYKKVIRDAKRILRGGYGSNNHPDAREFWLGLIVKTKGRMGWI
jgi:hypothetical protein